MVAIILCVFFLVVIGVLFLFSKKRKGETEGRTNAFSVNTLFERLLLSLKRFPISFVLVIGLASLFFKAIYTHFDSIPDKLWFFFPVGAFLSVSATLLAEDYFKLIKRYGISFAVVLFWGIYCFFLPDNLTMGKGIEAFVFSGSAFVSMWFISYLRKETDRQFWNFTTQMLQQFVIACFFGLVLFLGFLLAFNAIQSLFDIKMPDEVFNNLAVACFALFAPFYFLAYIPNQSEKNNTEIGYDKFLKILALYILMPILATYAIILYVYLFKIILAWELPNGWVSWLVSALALGGLLVISLLYPIRKTENNTAANFISQWFGLLILPLLVLMSVGIFRRIGDYGFTINRIYILLLNLWFYGIYIYLFISQSRHIKWILISPVVIALLSSVNIWGVAKITQHSLSQEVGRVLDKQMSFDEAKVLFAQMEETKKQRLKSTLYYLQKNFGTESLQPFFQESVSSGSFWLMTELGLKDLSSAPLEEGDHFSYYIKNDKTWPIASYNAFTTVSYYSNTYGAKRRFSGEKKKHTIEVKVDDQPFPIPIEEIALKYYNADKETREESDWFVREEEYTLILKTFQGYYFPQSDRIVIDNLEGYLFHNSQKLQNAE